MSMHQYIGARYVPYYYENSSDPTSTEWEPNVSYEPLTVVTLPNQHSYISKKFVPDTVGSPALNAEYWKDSGYDNAYIQALSDEIDDMKDGSITGSLQNQISTNATDIANMKDGNVSGSLQNQIDTLSTNISNVSTDLVHHENTNAITNHQVLIISDSYGEGYSPDGNTTPFTSVFQNEMGSRLTYFNSYSLGGAGLLGDQYSQTTYYQLLQTLSANVTNKSDITDIIFCGFANDSNFTDLTVVPTKLAQIKTYCVTNYPNAKIWFAPVGWNLNPNTSNRNFLFMSSLAGCVNYGINYMPYIDLVLHQRNVFSSDGLHPNQDGQNAIGEGLACVLRGGKISYYNKSLATFTPEANFSGVSDSFRIVRADDEIIVYKNTTNHWNPNSPGISCTFNQSFSVTIGTINSDFVIGNGLDSVCVNALVQIGSRLYQAPMMVAIFDGKITLTGSILNATYDNYLTGVVTDIQIPQFTLRMNAYN